MDNPSKPNDANLADDFTSKRESPRSEELYSPGEYACMYYAMTPPGCNRFNVQKTLDK